MKSKISTKFHRLLFPFYFFNIFGILFSISRTQTCTKIMKLFVVFYWKGWRFYQRFLENSKSCFKKYIDMWNIFFSKFCSLLFIFLFCYYFWHFIFNFVYLYLSKKFRKFNVFLFYRLAILSKNFGKSWNVFQKNIDIWNPKFFIYSIVYYLFFLILLAFW